MNSIAKTGSAALMALMLLMSVMVGGVAAVEYDEDESTLNDENAIEGFTFDADEEETIQADDLTEDAELHFIPADEDEDDPDAHVVLTSPEEVDAETDTYAFDFSHADLSGLEVTDGTIAEYDIEIVDDATLDDEEQSTHTLTVMIEADGLTYSIFSAVDSLESDGWFGLFGASEYTAVSDEINISSDNVMTGLGDATEDFEDVVGDDREAGDGISDIDFTVEGESMPIYYDEAPEDVDEDATYALYDDGEIEYVFGDDYEDRENLHTELSTDGLGFFEQFSVYGLGFDIPFLG